MEKTKLEKVMDIATKRGFFYPSAEIYGSKSGFWTYGSLGTKIKHKWEHSWRNYFLSLNTNFYEIDDVNILPKKVFESSGHLKNFNDPMTECEKCHFRFRADQLIDDELKMDSSGLNESELTKIIRDKNLKCSNCKG
ncbi:MAG TPA: glycine--tRNA ligase, partial [Candidatus Nanoarchaeia archaeon]|nr:glycine--tRNA ligase [Candidatus Nanoarchaeia archaeon]